MPVADTIIWSIVIINWVILVFVVFFERKSINVVLSWVLVFIFLPYIGYILYFFFGSSTKMKVLSRKYKLNIIEEEYQDRVLEVLKRDQKREKVESKNLVINEDNPLQILTTNNDVKLFAKTHEAFEQMFIDIEKAKESINVAYYIIKPKDDITQRMLKLLTKKAKEGVKVRLIYDRFGWIKTAYSDYRELIEAGGEVYPYLPSIMKRFLIINYHYHRKMLIVDGLVAHIGGINLADEYYGPSKKGPGWRDTNIRITGSAVTSLQFRYLADFTFLERQCNKDTLRDEDVVKSMFPEPIETKGMGVQIVSSGPDSEAPYVKDSYYKMINMAKDYLYIQTPYLAPDDTLMEALRISALNGCDVKIILPVIPDITYIHYVNSSFANELMEYGVKIYLYNGFIHAKTIVADDYISTVGTANFDIRSFRLDYEVNAFIYDRKFAKQMKETFMTDLENSKLVVIKPKRLRDRLLESIFRLLAPLV